MVAASKADQSGKRGQNRQFLRLAFRMRLKLARQQTGLTQQDVAKTMQKPQSFVSKCESGERWVDYVELQAFAKIYKVRISFFD